MALGILPLISFLLLLPVWADAQTVGSVTVDSWVSPSGDFAFGFHQLSNNKNLFLLAIWYNRIPEKTLVWGSKLQITADRGFVLNSPQGEQLWNSETRSEAVDRGIMDDSGNFMLLGSNSILWESFKDPADTVLPSQILDKGVALSSWQSETNFSKGRFQMVLQSDGDLVLATVNLPSKHVNDPYYKIVTAGDSNSSSPGFQLIFNESGYLFVLRENEERSVLTPTITGSAKDLYYRATLDCDGVFTLYSHPKASTGNDTRTSLCSGVCGFNSICSLNEDKRPSSGCPRGYALVDPSNQYGNCKPNFTLSCEEEPGPVEDLYEFEVLTNVGWPLGDYALLEPFTEDQFRQSCLHDCICAVAIFREGVKCWKKRLPLTNGRPVHSHFGAKAFLKVRKGDRPPFLLLGMSVFFIFILDTATCLGFYFINQKRLKLLPKNEVAVETNLRTFTYEELANATNEFKEDLRRGSFGIGYKGTLPTSYVSQVAVKRLNTVVHDNAEKEFKTEVHVIGQTHHRNLVRLLGFCDDGDNRLLVYEYLSNGSLASFLFCGSRPSWSQRTQIALGIARGLLYLHEECSTQIIHCDIKPQNILLDEHYNAKISDFGLAKLLLMNQSHTNTAIRGTKGYVAAEWFRNLPITVKVDVYSLGVLLLELTCCRKSVDMESDMEERAILTDWAYDCYCEGALDALVENDIDALNDIGKVEKFVQVAIWCIQEDPSLRATMRAVSQMLEGVGNPFSTMPMPMPISIPYALAS
ncbi:hypothetical protein ES319_A05G069200v1 [Gossypium barbadense]|uniref:non-specific serine/threonine protein kinase n=1 Tax=Gossypium barbadense TaxID=3634 RepID=A0A5J5VLG4_GOSBA|nr:hypothetical protein ES319_A05G069200v1 [Gossypium barbadense]